MPSFARQTLQLHGSYPDLLPADAPAEGWNNSNNVTFLNGETRRCGGDIPVMGVPLTLPRALVYFMDASGQPFWVYAGADGIFVTDGATHTNITPAAGWAPGGAAIYSAESYNGFVVINASTLAPVYWPGQTSAKCLPLPGWPVAWRCMSLRQHKWFLVAIGMLDQGGFQRVRWSSAAEAGTMPASWTPTEENEAGFVDILPASGPCIDGHTCRDSFLIFKDQSVSSLTFVGGNAIFAVRRLFNGIGVAGVNGITEGTSDQLLFVGADGDIYVTDGVSYRSVLDAKAQRSFYAEAGEKLIGSIAAVTLSREMISWVFYPSKGSPGGCDRAIGFAWESGDIGFRDVPLARCAASGRLLTPTAQLTNSWDAATGSWSQDNAVWNYSLTAETSEDVVIGAVDAAALPALVAFENTDLVETATPPPAWALKTGLAFGDAQTRKLATRLWPQLRGADGDLVTFRIGGQETAAGPVTWEEPQEHAIGSAEPVEAFASGRYLALEVSSSSGSPWALGSFDVEFRGLGQW